MVTEWRKDQGWCGAGLLLPGVWLEAVMLDRVLDHTVLDLCMLLTLWLRLDHAQSAGLVLLESQTWQPGE